MAPSCGVVACDRCLDRQHCSVCAADFVLSASGRKCILPAEVLMISATEALLALIVVVIVLGMAAKVAFVVSASRASRGRHKRMSDKLLGTQALNIRLKELNAQAIRVGLANWYRQRMTHQRKCGGAAIHPDLANQEESRCVKLCALLCDVHTKFIVGVGLPVFYNFHALPAIMALLCMAVTARATHASGYGDVDGDTSLEERQRRAVLFADQLYGDLFWLFWALLAISLLHARGQQVWRLRFDRINSTMEDYTLSLEGVPKSMTSEAELQRVVEEIFGVKVVGISIGYDLNDPRLPDLQDKVWRMKERVVVSRDIALSPEVGEDGFGYSDSLADPEELRLLHDGQDKREFREIAKRLRGSGWAWVVFGSKAHLDFVRSTWKGIWVDVDVEFADDKEWLHFRRCLSQASRVSGLIYLLHHIHIGGQRFGRGTVIYEMSEDHQRPRRAKLKKFVRVDHSSYEPPSVLWENLGTKPKLVQSRVLKTVAITFAVFVLLFGLIFMPLGRYLLQPYAAAHAAPGFVAQQLQGFIFGLANNVLGITMWLGAWGVGFRTWDHLNFFVVMFGVGVCYFNTVFFLAFGLSPELHGFCAAPLVGALGSGSVAEAAAQAFAAEEQLADTFFDTLVPGWLFSGFIMGQAIGNIWPNIQNMLLLSVVFACDCLPYNISKVIMLFVPYNPEPSRTLGQSRLTARQAELIFQPKELSLAWDYASYIVMPTVCIASMLILSPRMGAIYPVMLGWVVFMYLFHRLVTLRISKKQMYASANLVKGAAFLWGIPLSFVAAAWAFWGFRLGYNKWERVVVAPVASALLYMGGLFFMEVMDQGHVYGEIDVDYWHVAERLRFTWFNCNPIHVLKSIHAPEAFGGKHVSATTPFFFGKEYLFREDGAADRPA